MNLIILVGFMGSGKSTVGKALARRLKCPFIDLDERIEAAAGCPISEIFDRQGEEAFRELEHRELLAVLREAGDHAAVMALGGGAFTQPRNLEAITRCGAVSVWLDAPAAVLLARCAHHDTDRPLARDSRRFLRLYQERLPFYARASLCVKAARKPRDVVEEILANLASSKFKARSSRFPG